MEEYRDFIVQNHELIFMAAALLMPIALQPVVIWILIFEWESLVFGDLNATLMTVIQYRRERDAAQEELDNLRGQHGN